MMASLKKHLPLLLFLTGGILCLHTYWIEIKAVIAQELIASAWNKAQVHPQRPQVKPWPWADFTPVAKLSYAMPQGDTESLYVLSGSHGQSLAFGPGHLQQSTPPGQQGQVIIAGHKDTHFAFLEHSQTGDIVHIEDNRGQIREFRITQKTVVNSDQQQLWFSDNDELVLITCYPFNSLTINGPLRLVVRAEPLDVIKI